MHALDTKMGISKWGHAKISHWAAVWKYLTGVHSSPKLSSEEFLQAK